MVRHQVTAFPRKLNVPQFELFLEHNEPRPPAYAHVSLGARSFPQRVFCPVFIPCFSAYAKLGMISSALSSDSDDVTKLLNVSLDLITASNAPNAASNEAQGGQTGPDAKPSPASASEMGARMGGLKGGAAIADSERAVEVLSFLVSKTKVRRTSRTSLPFWAAFLRYTLLESQNLNGSCCDVVLGITLWDEDPDPPLPLRPARQVLEVTRGAFGDEKMAIA